MAEFNNTTFNKQQPYLKGSGISPFVIDPKAILKGIAAGQIKSLIFDVGDASIEQSDQQSYLNTAVFSNLIFEPDPSTGSTGTFTDIDGIDQSFSGLRIDTVLFQVAQSKNIVKTAVQGFNGTVKEYTSDGDFEITVAGSIVGQNPNEYPENDVQKFIKLMSIPEPLEITSEFLGIFGITNVVVESFGLQQSAGFRNVQPFTIRMLSDRPIELS
jgi:hypothetical protein